MLDNLDKMKELAQQICVREGCELYGIDFSAGSQGKGRKVLVYVEKQGGVSLDDCERVSKGLSLILDVEDIIPGGDYILEVSSPGLERPLKEKKHFELVIGKKIYVQSNESIIPENPENYKRFKVSGVLETVAGEEITVAAEGKQFVIPIGEIKKANVVFEYETSSKKKTN